MNPHQHEDVASSRTGVCYCMGPCPECGRKMMLTTVCTHIAYTACCHTPRIYGDEVASCPCDKCSLHSVALCLNGKHGCRYTKLRRPPSQFTTAVEEELSDRLDLGVSAPVPESACAHALEIIQRAALDSNESSLDVKLQWYRPETPTDPVHKVLAPLPPLVKRRATHGALQKSSGRRTLIHLKKMIRKDSPSALASQKNPQRSERKTDVQGLTGRP